MCFRVSGVCCIRLLAVTMILAFLSGAEGGQLNAATYYLSPTGSDGNSGTSAAPWKTFNYAVPKLRPGDTLILKDGAYTGSNSGWVNINGGVNAVNGTSSAPITIKAENERKAHIDGDGSNYPFNITNCSYWVINGLYVSNADNSAGPAEGSNLRAYNSSHLTFKRNLLYHNNRYKNGSILLLYHTTDSLVEENEAYYYSRGGMQSATADRNTFRRNYANSRSCPDLTGGYPSNDPTKGDTGFHVYPGSNNLMENNISEGNWRGFDVMATGVTIGNNFYGNIALSNNYAGVISARGTGIDYMPRSTYHTNFLSLKNLYGLYARSAKDTRCDNCTDIGGTSGIVADQASEWPGDGTYSFISTNSLVTEKTADGFKVANQTTWTIDHPSSYENSIAFYPTASDPNITNVLTSNPTLGACYAWIPDGSPLKRAGTNREDVGANILYRYENGVLTSTPLWDPSTGAFPCGAIVAGINDVAGSSCSKVHERLNINRNGCSFPAGYGQDKSIVSSPPSNLRIVN